MNKIPELHAVWLPRDPAAAAEWGLAPGAALTGRPEAGELGVLLGSNQAQVRFADRVAAVLEASDEQPRLVVPEAQLRQIGWYRPSHGQVELFPGQERALAVWLGSVELDGEQLQCSSARYLMLRRCEALLASRVPEDLEEARRLARRSGMSSQLGL